MLSVLDTPPQGDFEDKFLFGFIIAGALATLIFLACHPQHQVVKKVAGKDTTTGHWEYYDGSEDMRWVPNQPKN